MGTDDISPEDKRKNGHHRQFVLYVEGAAHANGVFLTAHGWRYTIKASGAENGFFEKWSGYQASVNAQKVKAETMNSCLGMIPTFLSTLANYAVMVMGIYFVMNGRFTLGTLQMFQGFLGSFMAPAMTLVSAGDYRKSS